MIWCFMQWADEHFGPLQYDIMIKVLTISITGVALALQFGFHSISLRNYRKRHLIARAI